MDGESLYLKGHGALSLIRWGNKMRLMAVFMGLCKTRDGELVEKGEKLGEMGEIGKGVIKKGDFIQLFRYS